MNISYNWLKELIDIHLPPDDLGARLTSVGLAVEGIHAHKQDFVFDIDLTSNRPDCLSHLGVAREVAAISEKDLHFKEPSPMVPLPSVLAGEIVRIEAPEVCHRFTAQIINNVKIGPSPQWLVDRLEAIGERSINNVADITNYVMHELGQPMHSFDRDKLAQGRIVVRLAHEGENITTLDEEERKAYTSMLMICDAEKPVAIAGIMGGMNSCITDATINVLLEVAYFAPENIRATSRQLRLSTEASYRFERGVDIDNLIRASNRATELIAELAGGTPGDLIDLYPTRFTLHEIESPDISAAVKRLTGLDVSNEECSRILNSLGLRRKQKSDSLDRNQIFVSPSWRHDLAIEEDLVEEIARHAGYENIAAELPPAFGAGEYQATELREKLLRRTLVDMGFDEALSYSFIDTRFDDVFEPVPGLVDITLDEKFVTLQDSVIDGAVRMRHTIMPGLLDAARLNFNHKRRDLKLFELGTVFAARSDGSGLPAEQKSIGFVVTGGDAIENHAAALREMDFYDAKGAVEAALNAARILVFDFVPVEVKHLRIGQAAAVAVNGKNIGWVGRLSDEIAGTYKFKQAVYVAEINLQSAMTGVPEAVAYRPLGRFPGIVRDVSFVIDRNISFAAIRGAITEQQYELCKDVLFVDIYEGQGLAADERSITIRLDYRSDERTLIEDEVEAAHKKIVANVEKKLSIRQRF